MEKILKETNSKIVNLLGGTRCIKKIMKGVVESHIKLQKSYTKFIISMDENQYPGFASLGMDFRRYVASFLCSNEIIIKQSSEAYESLKRLTGDIKVQLIAMKKEKESLARIKKDNLDNAPQMILKKCKDNFEILLLHSNDIHRRALNSHLSSLRSMRKCNNEEATVKNTLRERQCSIEAKSEVHSDYSQELGKSVERLEANSKKREKNSQKLGPSSYKFYDQESKLNSQILFN